MDGCDSGLGDIEDFAAAVAEPRDAASRPGLVLTQQRKKRADRDAEAKQATDSAGVSVPGTQKVWVRTFGCSHNVSDSEYMQGQLDSYGYQLVDKKEDADVWLVNSCTVKNPSQSAFVNIVKRAQRINKPIVVAGCVPQGDRNLNGLEDVSVIGVQQIDRVVEVVEETLKGHAVKLLAKKELPLLDLPKIRKNPLVEIIPLSTGCLGSCTYCKTRHARGKLGSYALDAIVNRARTVIDEGVTEIWLSSEDTGAYGLDIGTDVTVMLKSLIRVLPKNVILRLGMTNPPYILNHLADIAECLNHPNVYAFLHVPVQSGSNKVLKDMNREYTREEFEQVADYMIEHVPGITIMTDFICGFPGETDEEFEESMSLYRKYMLPFINISQFYARPGTPAAKMKPQANSVKKTRSRALTALYHSHQPLEHLVGAKCRVWINNEVSDDGRHTVGHTKSYVKVLIDRDDTLKGTDVMCELVGFSRWHVLGNVLQEEPDRTQPPPPAIPAPKPARMPTSDYTSLQRQARDGDVAAGAGAGAGAGAATASEGDKAAAATAVKPASLPERSRQPPLTVVLLSTLACVLAIVLVILLKKQLTSEASPASVAEALEQFAQAQLQNEG